LDIVEADGKPVAKRGKLGGRKMVWRCDDCLTEKVTGATTAAPNCPNCEGRMGKMLAPLLSKGRLPKALPSADKIRERVLGQLGRLDVSKKRG
jgi:nicotinate phosphoribosyltransferase